MRATASDKKPETMCHTARSRHIARIWLVRQRPNELRRQRWGRRTARPKSSAGSRPAVSAQTTPAGTPKPRDRWIGNAPRRRVRKSVSSSAWQAADLLHSPYVAGTSSSKCALRRDSLHTLMITDLRTHASRCSRANGAQHANAGFVSSLSGRLAIVREETPALRTARGRTEPR